MRAGPRGPRPIVERELLARDLLALLVPLAGDHDDVACLGEVDCALDRRATVRVDLDVGAGALKDVLDDRAVDPRCAGCPR